MSKLIVEMEMPKDLAVIVTILPDGRIFKHLGYKDKKQIGKILGVLPDEHGDLIDRDAFIHKYLAFYTEQERKKNLVFAAVEVKQQFADMICDERALIGAERKDDEQTH